MDERGPLTFGRGRLLSFFAAASIALAAASVTGSCASRPGSTLRRAPEAVRISLVQLARMAPAWSSVTDFDRVADASLAPTALVAAPSLVSIPSVSTVLTDGRQREQASGAKGSLSSAELAKLAFDVAAERAVTQVQDRLERDQTRLMSVARQEALARIDAGIVDARSAATERYLASLPALLQSGSEQRTNLRVQISALSVDANPQNPATAPDDHWGKLLAARRKALLEMETPQSLADRAADQQIAQAVAAARADLERQRDDELAAYQSDLELHRKNVLARQQIALRREQTDLLAVASELNRELAQPLAAFSRPAHDGGSVALAGSASGYYSAPAGEGTEFAPPGSAKAKLADQRARLVAQVLNSTRLEAERAASELGLQIVDWNADAPSDTAMRRILRRMQQDCSNYS